MMQYILLLFVLGINSGVLGSTVTAGVAKIRPGTNEKYCLEFGNNKEWKVDQTETDWTACSKCTCGATDGLNCVGIGHAAGIADKPGCTMNKLARCCYQFVKPDGTNCGSKVCPP